MAGKERIKTFIKGFDEQMNGGVPKRHVVLISGTPGTMKSTLGLNILVNNAREGTRGLYLSLEQSEESLANHARSIGLDIRGMDNIELRDILKEREETSRFILEDSTLPFRERIERVFSLIEDAKPELFVLDSLSALYCISSMDNPRYDMYNFFLKLKGMDITTFLVSEMSPDRNSYSEHGVEDFLADGILHLKMEKVDDISVQRRIRCVKMRGTDHTTDYFALLYENGGFVARRVLTE